MSIIKSNIENEKLTNPNELTKPIWAVITDKEILNTGLMYSQAIVVRDNYAKASHNGGVAIVTDKAAREMGRNMSMEWR